MGLLRLFSEAVPKALCFKIFRKYPIQMVYIRWLVKKSEAYPHRPVGDGAECLVPQSRAMVSASYTDAVF